MKTRKPFQAKPVRLGSYALAQERTKRRAGKMRVVRTFAITAVPIFIFGMAVTHWKSVRTAMPVFYRNCTAARRAGAAPIRQGEPGYRLALDADADGIACEPYTRP